MGSGYEGASDGTDETCPFAQVHGICSMEKILFVSEVATGCINYYRDSVVLCRSYKSMEVSITVLLSEPKA